MSHRPLKSWDDFRLICMHGVREELDYHDCSECRKLTDEHFGPNEPTHLWKRKPRKNEKVINGKLQVVKP